MESVFKHGDVQLFQDEDTRASLDLFIETLEADAKEEGLWVPPSPWHVASDSSVDMYSGLGDASLLVSSPAQDSSGLPSDAVSSQPSVTGCKIPARDARSRNEGHTPLTTGLGLSAAHSADQPHSSSVAKPSSHSTSGSRSATRSHSTSGSHSASGSRSATRSHSASGSHSVSGSCSASRSQKTDGSFSGSQGSGGLQTVVGTHEGGSRNKYLELKEKHRTLRKNMLSLCYTAQREMEHKQHIIAELRKALESSGSRSSPERAQPFSRDPRQGEHSRGSAKQSASAECQAIGQPHFVLPAPPCVSAAKSQAMAAGEDISTRSVHIQAGLTACSTSSAQTGTTVVMDKPVQTDSLAGMGVDKSVQTDSLQTNPVQMDLTPKDSTEELGVNIATKCSPAVLDPLSSRTHHESSLQTDPKHSFQGDPVPTVRVDSVNSLQMDFMESTDEGELGYRETEREQPRISGTANLVSAVTYDINTPVNVASHSADDLSTKVTKDSSGTDDISTVVAKGMCGADDLNTDVTKDLSGAYDQKKSVMKELLPGAGNQGMPVTGELPSADDQNVSVNAELSGADDLITPVAGELLGADKLSTPLAGKMSCVSDLKTPVAGELSGADDFCKPLTPELPSSRPKVKERKRKDSTKKASRAPSHADEDFQGGGAQHAESGKRKRQLAPPSEPKEGWKKRARSELPQDDSQVQFSTSKRPENMTVMHSSPILDTECLPSHSELASVEIVRNKTPVLLGKNPGTVSDLQSPSTIDSSLWSTVSEADIREEEGKSGQSFLHTDVNIEQTASVSTGHFEKNASKMDALEEACKLESRSMRMEHCADQCSVERIAQQPMLLPRAEVKERHPLPHPSHTHSSHEARGTPFSATQLHLGHKVWGRFRHVKGVAWGSKLLLWPCYAHRRVSRRQEIDAVYYGQEAPKVYNWSSKQDINSMGLQHHSPEENQTLRHSAEENDSDSLQPDQTDRTVTKSLQTEEKSLEKKNDSQLESVGEVAASESSSKAGKICPSELEKMETIFPDPTTLTTNTDTSSVHKHKKKKKKLKKSDGHSVKGADEKRKQKKKKRDKTKVVLIGSSPQKVKVDQEESHNNIESQKITENDRKYLDRNTHSKEMVGIDQNDLTKDSDGSVSVSKALPETQVEKPCKYRTTPGVLSSGDALVESCSTKQQSHSVSDDLEPPRTPGLPEQDSESCHSEKGRELDDYSACSASWQNDCDLDKVCEGDIDFSEPPRTPGLLEQDSELYHSEKGYSAGSTSWENDCDLDKVCEGDIIDFSEPPRTPGLPEQDGELCHSEKGRELDGCNVFSTTHQDDSHLDKIYEDNIDILEPPRTPGLPEQDSGLCQNEKGSSLDGNSVVSRSERGDSLLDKACESDSGGSEPPRTPGHPEQDSALCHTKKNMELGDSSMVSTTQKGDSLLDKACDSDFSIHTDDSDSEEWLFKKLPSKKVSLQCLSIPQSSVTPWDPTSDDDKSSENESDGGGIEQDESENEVDISVGIGAGDLADAIKDDNVRLSSNNNMSLSEDKVQCPGIQCPPQAAAKCFQSTGKNVKLEADPHKRHKESCKLTPSASVPLFMAENDSAQDMSSAVSSSQLSSMDSMSGRRCIQPANSIGKHAEKIPVRDRTIKESSTGGGSEREETPVVPEFPPSSVLEVPSDWTGNSDDSQKNRAQIKSVPSGKDTTSDRSQVVLDSDHPAAATKEEISGNQVIGVDLSDKPNTPICCSQLPVTPKKHWILRTKMAAQSAATKDLSNPSVIWSPDKTCFNVLSHREPMSHRTFNDLLGLASNSMSSEESSVAGVPSFDPTLSCASSATQEFSVDHSDNQDSQSTSTDTQKVKGDIPASSQSQPSLSQVSRCVEVVTESLGWMQSNKETAVKQSADEKKTNGGVGQKESGVCVEEAQTEAEQTSSWPEDNTPLFGYPSASQSQNTSHSFCYKRRPLYLPPFSSSSASSVNVSRSSSATSTSSSFSIEPPASLQLSTVTVSPRLSNVAEKRSGLNTEHTDSEHPSRQEAVLSSAGPPTQPKDVHVPVKADVRQACADSFTQKENVQSLSNGGRKESLEQVFHGHCDENESNGHASDDKFDSKETVEDVSIHHSDMTGNTESVSGDTEGKESVKCFTLHQSRDSHSSDNRQTKHSPGNKQRVVNSEHVFTSLDTKSKQKKMPLDENSGMESDGFTPCASVLGTPSPMVRQWREDLEEGEIDSMDSLCKTPSKSASLSGSAAPRVYEGADQSLEEGEIKSSNECDDECSPCGDVITSSGLVTPLAPLGFGLAEDTAFCDLREMLAYKRQRSPEGSQPISSRSKRNETGAEKAVNGTEIQSHNQDQATKSAGQKHMAPGEGCSQEGDSKKRKLSSSGPSGDDDKETNQGDKQVQQRRQISRDSLEKMRRQIVGKKISDRDQSRLKRFTIPKLKRRTKGREVQKGQRVVFEDTCTASLQSKRSREGDDRLLDTSVHSQHSSVADDRYTRCSSRGKKPDPIHHSQLSRVADGRPIRRASKGGNRQTQYTHRFGHRNQGEDKHTDSSHPSRHSRVGNDRHSSLKDDRHGEHSNVGEDRHSRRNSVGDERRTHSTSRDSTPTRCSREGEDRRTRHCTTKDSRHTRQGTARGDRRIGSSQQHGRKRSPSADRNLNRQDSSTSATDGGCLSNLSHSPLLSASNSGVYRTPDSCGLPASSATSEAEHSLPFTKNNTDSGSGKSPVQDSVGSSQPLCKSSVDDTQLPCESSVGSRQPSENSAVSRQPSFESSLGSIQPPQSCAGSKQLAVKSPACSEQPCESSVGSGQPPCESSVASKQPACESSLGSKQQPCESSLGSKQQTCESSVGSKQPPCESSVGSKQPPCESSVGSKQPPCEGSVGSKQHACESSVGTRQRSCESTSGSKQPGGEELTPALSQSITVDLRDTAVISMDWQNDGGTTVKSQPHEDMEHIPDQYPSDGDTDCDDSSDGDFDTASDSDSLTDLELEGSFRTRGFIYYRDPMKPRPELEINYDEEEEGEEKQKNEGNETGQEKDEEMSEENDDDKTQDEEDDKCDDEETEDEDENDEDDEGQQSSPGDADRDDHGGGQQDHDSGRQEQQDKGHYDNGNTSCQENEEEPVEDSTAPQWKEGGDCEEMCARTKESLHLAQKKFACKAFSHGQEQLASTGKHCENDGRNTERLVEKDKSGHSEGSQNENAAVNTDDSSKEAENDKEMASEPEKNNRYEKHTDCVELHSDQVVQLASKEHACSLQTSEAESISTSIASHWHKSPPHLQVDQEVSADCLSLHLVDGEESFLLVDQEREERGISVERSIPQGQADRNRQEGDHHVNDTPDTSLLVSGSHLEGKKVGAISSECPNTVQNNTNSLDENFGTTLKYGHLCQMGKETGGSAERGSYQRSTRNQQSHAVSDNSKKYPYKKKRSQFKTLSESKSRRISRRCNSRDRDGRGKQATLKSGHVYAKRRSPPSSIKSKIYGRGRYDRRPHCSHRTWDSPYCVRRDGRSGNADSDTVKSLKDRSCSRAPKSYRHWKRSWQQRYSSHNNRYCQGRPYHTPSLEIREKEREKPSIRDRRHDFPLQERDQTSNRRTVEDCDTDRRGKKPINKEQKVERSEREVENSKRRQSVEWCDGPKKRRPSKGHTGTECDHCHCCQSWWEGEHATHSDHKTTKACQTHTI